MAKKSVSKGSELSGIEGQPEGWAVCYKQGERWQSDLQFLEDELRFFRSLVDKYFVWLVEENWIEKMKILAAKLTRLEKSRSKVVQQITNHMKNLAAHIQKPLPQDTSDYLGKHARLADTMMDFENEIREIKKSLFEITEQVMESKKAQLILGR